MRQWTLKSCNSSGAAAFYPDDTVVTYENELADTHNAMDHPSGTFYAPFAGSYGFIFYFRSEHRQFNELFARHNGNRFAIHYVNTQVEDSHLDTCNSVYFARYLNPGESIQIDSGSAHIYTAGHQAKFMGFLLNKA